MRGFTMPTLRPAGVTRTALLVLLSLSLSACSLKKMAVNSVAGMLSESGSTFSSDEDPELVRDAVPFALKLYESLLESVPENQDLLRATCSVFTQYAYAFVQLDAEVVEQEDFLKAEDMRARTLKLYLRGRGYCLRALELRHAGVGQTLMLDPRTPSVGRASETSNCSIGQARPGERPFPSGRISRRSSPTSPPCAPSCAVRSPSTTRGPMVPSTAR